MDPTRRHSQWNRIDEAGLVNDFLTYSVAFCIVYLSNEWIVVLLSYLQSSACIDIIYVL